MTTGLSVDVLYMLNVGKLLHQISELKLALLFENAHLVNSVVGIVEHALDMRFVGGGGYGLSQQIDKKLDELICHVTEPVLSCPACCVH